MSNSIKKKTIKGVVWSAVERFSSIGVQLICTLIIARYVSPSDYGVVGMLTIFTAIAQCLVDSGFRLALIRKKDVSMIDFSSVFFFNVFISLLLYAVLYFFSSDIANFYNLPILEKVSKISFLAIPISSIGLIQSTILTKNLDFRKLTYCSLSATFLSGIIGVVLAYMFKSVWAIVIQNISFFALQSIFLWLYNTWRPKLVFSIKSIKEMSSFSINMMLSSLLGTIFNNINSLIIGKIYTADALGNYSQAQKLQSLPSTSITEVIQRVTYPVLSKFQNDEILLKNAYKKIIGITFYIVSIIMFWFICTSSALFNILFNDEWQTAGKFFAILCFNGIFYPLHSININILSVRGKSKKYLYLEISRRLILISIIVITSLYDIYIFVLGQVLYSVIVLILNLYVCGKEINYSTLQQIRDLFPTFMLGLTIMILIKFTVPLILLFNEFIIFFVQSIIYFFLVIVISHITRLTAYNEMLDILNPYLNKIKFRSKQ